MTISAEDVVCSRIHLIFNDPPKMARSLDFLYLICDFESSVNYHFIKTAAAIIKEGGVVAYPTEHCFGLGCDPRNTDAIERILRMKRRQKSKGLILIADQVSRFNHYILGIPNEHKQEVLASWPGPFTWLVPARGSVSRWLRGRHSSIAIRVTGHPEARALSRLCATPIVSTSANRAGKPVLTTDLAVEREFAGEVDYVIKGRVGRASAPSTIRNSLTGQTLRAG